MYIMCYSDCTVPVLQHCVTATALALVQYCTVLQYVGFFKFQFEQSVPQCTETVLISFFGNEVTVVILRSYRLRSKTDTKLFFHVVLQRRLQLSFEYQRA